MNYNSTKKYYNRLMDEVSNGIYAVDRQIIAFFKSRKVKEITKGTNIENILHYQQFDTEYNLWENSIKIVHNMRFIYMMALFEAFVSEYLDEKEVDDSSAKCDWNKSLKYNAINKSTSKLNTEYLQHIIQYLFKIDLKLNGIGKEIGSLRNCIAHTNGIIAEKDIPLLKNILSKLGLPLKVGTKIIIDEDFITEILGIIIGIILSCDSITKFS